jgi:hypothetical protein
MQLCSGEARAEEIGVQASGEVVAVGKAQRVLAKAAAEK